MSEYIEREALRHVFEEQEKQAKELWKTVRDDYHAALVISSRDSIKLIDKMPNADVAPVMHGRWLAHRDYMGEISGFWLCSACKRLSSHKHDYCPNCGAKMSEKE